MSMLTDFTSWATGNLPQINVSGRKIVGKCGIGESDLEFAQDEASRRRVEGVRRYRARVAKDADKKERNRLRQLVYSRRYRAKKRGEWKEKTETGQFVKTWREDVGKFLSAWSGDVFTIDILRIMGVKDLVVNSIESRAAARLLREFGWKSTFTSINAKKAWIWRRAEK